jgi:hypothetical protein
MASLMIRPSLALIGSLAVCAALAWAPDAPAAALPPAIKPPLVHTGYAPQVTTSSATLKAVVNPNGMATTYYFQYGPTAAYGSVSPSASAGEGTQETSVTQVITGLTPGTTYHYRAVAISSVGRTNGQDATVTTKKVPLSLSIATITPAPVVFGEPLSVSGTLSGTGNAGVAVVLQANPYPYLHGFQSIGAPLLTNADGGFLFPLPGLSQSTELRVALDTEPTVHSLATTERVTLRVTLHVHATARHGFVRLYGTVAPAQQHRVRVAFERLTNGARYVPVSGTRLKPGRGGRSRFSRVLHLRPGVYRVLVPAYGALVSGRSLPVVIR